MKEYIKNEKFVWILIFLFAALTYFPFIFRPIRDAESKYVEIPREIIITKDWVTPHLNFAKYYTKPPLTFWIVAIGYKIFGVKEWVARALNIVWAFFAAFLIGLMTLYMFGKKVAPIASASFLLTSEVFAYGLDAGIEFALISCIIASLLCFWLFWQKKEKKFIRYFYICIGFSFLIKGFIGFIIPCSIIFLFFLFNKKLNKIKEVIDFIGICLFLIAILPWFVLMVIKNPEFFKYYIINEYIGRFIGKRDTPEAFFPTTLFLAHVAGEFFPWILYLPIIIKAFVFGLRDKELKEKSLFLLIWALFPLLLFSISKSKSDFYGMHVYPPLLVLLSYEIKRLIENKDSSIKLWAYPWVILSGIALFSLIFLHLRQDSSFIKSLELPSIVIAKVFLLVSFVFGIILWYLLMKKDIKKTFLCIVIYICILFICIERMYVADFKRDSMKFAADIYNQMGMDIPIFCANLPEFAHVGVINFYTKKPVLILKNSEDGLPGYKDRRKRYVDEKEFIKILKDKKAAFLVGKTETLKKKLKNMGLRYSIVKSSADRSAFLVFID